MNTETAPQVEIQLPELPEPQKECWIGHDLYSADQMRAYAQAALNARDGGDDYVLVPKQMHVDADAWEAASFAFGGPGTGEGEAYMDCTLWIGEVEQDDGSKLHGLHVSCDECPDEGCITLATFPAALASQAVGVKDGRA